MRSSATRPAVASGRDIRLEKDIEQGVYANMDVGLMARLVQNLVENAFKYTAEGGTVRVGLHTSGGRLTLSVSDTGIGIDKKDLPHIWERFWQADSSRGVDRGSASASRWSSRSPRPTAENSASRASPARAAPSPIRWNAVTKNSFSLIVSLVLTKRAKSHIMQTWKLRKARYATWQILSA